jgi:glycosyltransferase involved in cell wall biosynthesis
VDSLCRRPLGMPRMLMIINFFPPAGGGGVYRPLSFVKYLARLGWDLTVITPRPGEFWISDPALEDEVPSQVRVVRTASLSGLRALGMLSHRRVGNQSRRSSRAFGALRRLGELFLVPDTYVGWVPFAVKEAARLIAAERFAAIYSTSPPDSSHLAALWIARRRSIPWIADFRDPWINLFLREPPTPLHRLLHERMERATARADLLLVTTEAQEEALRRRHPQSRVVRIPNGYDDEDFVRDAAVRPPAEPFTITHCGMLTLGRSVQPFLEGLALLARRAPEKAGVIRVAFIGARESANEESARRLGLGDTVRFEDNLPHREVIRRERESHILLLIKHDDERYRGLVPGKLYEYVGARRPILAIAPDGEARRLVVELRRGEVAAIGKPDDVAGKLERFYDRWRDGTLESAYSLGEVPEFSRRAQAERLAALIAELCAGAAKERKTCR